MFDAVTKITTVEILSYPERDGTQAYICHATSPTLDDREGVQRRLRSVSYGSGPSGLSSSTQTLIEKLQNRLPNGIEISPGSLDFTPLGVSAATTTRALIPKNRRLPSFSKIEGSPLARILERLEDEPHLYQVVVRYRPDQQKYTATIRTALFNPDYQASTSADLKRWDNEGVPCDPIGALERPFDLRSSISVVGGFTRSTSTRTRIQGHWDYTDHSTIRKIRRGTYEYRNLLRGRDSSPPVYENAGKYPNILLDEAQLRHFLGVRGIDRSRNVWELAPGRHPPEFKPLAASEDSTTNGTAMVSLASNDGDGTRARAGDTRPQQSASAATTQTKFTTAEASIAGGDADEEAIGGNQIDDGLEDDDLDAEGVDDERIEAAATAGSATASDPSTGTDTADDPTGEASSTEDTMLAGHPNDGGPEHRIGIRRLVRILREQGYDATAVTQDGQSRPDIWARSDDGTIYPVELAVKSQTKPAKLLNNVARANYWDYEVIVVALETADEQLGPRQKQQKAAEWAINVLAKPFRTIDGDRTRLYNRSNPVETDDGKELLLPKEVDTPTAEWWLHPDGTLELEVDGEVLAEGDAREPISAFDHSLDRVYTDDEGQYVVEDDDGTRLNVYPTKDRFKRDRTKLNPPHVPRDLSYLPWVESVRMLTENGLFEREPSASWDTNRASERHEGSIADFFETFVVDRPSERLLESECRSFAKKWIDHLTPHGPPTNNVFGRYRKQHVTRRANSNVPESKRRFYDEVAWRFPRGLESPALPTVSDSPDLPDGWEETRSESGAGSDDESTQAADDDGGDDHADEAAADDQADEVTPEDQADEPTPDDQPQTTDEASDTGDSSQDRSTADSD